MFKQYIDSSSQQQYVLKPNRSLNWKQNKLIITIICLLGLIVSLLFSYFELWPIIPFITMTCLLFSLSIYYCMLQGREQEVITISNEHCRIQRGREQLIQEVSLPAQWSQFSSQTNPRTGKPEALYISCYGRKYQIGAFLNQQELESLSHELRARLIKIIR